jgi:hypothetical protein
MMDAFLKFRQGDHDLQTKAITTHGGQGTATKTETFLPRAKTITRKTLPYTASQPT